MAICIASIVEGHSEVASLPILLRRLAERYAPLEPLELPLPIRVKKDRFVRDDAEFARYVELAARKAGSGGRILILLDADDDCPAVLGPELLRRALAARSDRRISVVFARREFESWFLAAANSLGFNRPPGEPEAIRGAKEWIASQLPHGGYAETIHQPSLTARFDVEAANTAPSFDKLRRDFLRLTSE